MVVGAGGGTSVAGLDSGRLVVGFDSGTSCSYRPAVPDAGSLHCTPSGSYCHCQNCV